MDASRCRNANGSRTTDEMTHLLSPSWAKDDTAVETGYEGDAYRVRGLSSPDGALDGQVGAGLGMEEPFLQRTGKTSLLLLRRKFETYTIRMVIHEDVRERSVFTTVGSNPSCQSPAVPSFPPDGTTRARVDPSTSFVDARQKLHLVFSAGRGARLPGSLTSDALVHIDVRADGPETSPLLCHVAPWKTPEGRSETPHHPFVSH